MANRYIPPVLRNKTNATAIPPQEVEDSLPVETRDDASLVSAEDIMVHFFPLDVITPSSPQRPAKGTLHASAANPSSLAFVMLYEDANPRWKNEGVIFTKTRIDLLPGHDEAVEGASQDGQTLTQDAQQSSHAAMPTPSPAAQTKTAQHVGPIAVFEQVRGSQLTRSFKFLGWYKLARVSFLEPQSADLVRMLEQKWQRINRYGRVREVRRDAESWNASLRHRWAVLKLARDEAADEEKGPLVVQRLAEREKAADEVHGEGTLGRRVNEMLAEMRIRDGARSSEL